MPEVKFTKQEIIVINKVGANSFGDFTFTDKAEKEYKISVKRKGYFDKIIIPDATIQLNYAMSSFGKEYIYSAEQIGDKLPPPIPTPTTYAKPIAETKPPTLIAQEVKTMTKDEQIERAVWIKELGECLRSGEIDKTTPQGKALRNFFYTEMSRVLGINIKGGKEAQPAKSRLVEAAKKLGATEIEKGEE